MSWFRKLRQWLRHSICYKVKTSTPLTSLTIHWMGCNVLIIHHLVLQNKFGHKNYRYYWRRNDVFYTVLLYIRVFSSYLNIKWYVPVTELLSSYKDLVFMCKLFMTYRSNKKYVIKSFDKKPRSQLFLVYYVNDT